eukprot:2845476-Prymnesium_polylepis.1
MATCARAHRQSAHTAREEAHAFRRASARPIAGRLRARWSAARRLGGAAVRGTCLPMTKPS